MVNVAILYDAFAQVVYEWEQCVSPSSLYFLSLVSRSVWTDTLLVRPLDPAMYIRMSISPNPFAPRCTLTLLRVFRLLLRLERVRFSRGEHSGLPT